MSRLVVLGIAFAALLAPGAGGAPREPVLGLETAPGGGTLLAQYDALSLRRTGLGVRLRVAGWPWRRSPDGALIAFGDGAPGGSVELLDVRSLRRVVASRPRVGLLMALAWPRPGRLIAAGVRQPGAVDAALVDSATGAVVRRVRIDGHLVGADATAVGLTLVVGPPAGIGPARLVHLDDGLRITADVVLSRLRAGQVRPARTPSPGDPPPRTETPAVAVDPRAGRAWVVGNGAAGRQLAEVDLASGALAYRLLPVRRPAAVAKTLLGSGATVLWLGDGRLAVAGVAYEGRSYRGLGLAIVDVETGTARLVDPYASWVERSGALLVSWTEIDGVGVFDLDGRPLRRVLGGRNVASFAAAGRRALVQPTVGEPVLVVDLASGRVLGRRDAARVPYGFLLGQGSRLG